LIFLSKELSQLYWSTTPKTTIKAIIFFIVLSFDKTNIVVVAIEGSHFGSAKRSWPVLSLATIEDEEVITISVPITRG
jgi:hypothetical protein